MSKLIYISGNNIQIVNNIINVLSNPIFSSVTATTIVTDSIYFNYIATGSTYTIQDSDYTIDCTGGTFNVYLPTASLSNKGRVLTIINSGNGLITLTGITGTQTIGNSSTSPTYQPIYNGNSVTIQSTGNAFRII